MTTKCEHCKGTRIEPGEACCTWCDNTGMETGLSSEVISDLKPFRLLPYGAKFRYRGTTDVWVRTAHNLVAEWPSRVSAADGTPIQSLCSFCHLDGDESGNTLDTLVDVVDQPVAEGITWKAQGDANFYVLLKDGNWFAAIQLNGEMLVSQHEAFLNSICPQHEADANGKARDV